MTKPRIPDAADVAAGQPSRGGAAADGLDLPTERAGHEDEGRGRDGRAA